MLWQVKQTREFGRWFDQLNQRERDLIIGAVEALRLHGPGLGRPLVDSIKGSAISNLKELRRGSFRVLFVFDPDRAALLLVGGNKRGRWEQWYDDAIPEAERLYVRYVRGKGKREE